MLSCYVTFEPLHFVKRSVADLTQQLASEKSKVKELDSHLETQQDINRGLQEQISLLEQRIHSEEARSKEVKVCCMINVLFQSFLVIKHMNLVELLYLCRK